MRSLHDLGAQSVCGTKRRKRVGRGPGSGMGKTCCRGQKGMGARSGSKRRLTYEGGQFRLFMKLPTRGFSNFRFRKEYHPINLGQLEKLFEAGETVTVAALKSKGLVSGRDLLVKLLAEGELTKGLTVELHAVSKTAREKLEKAGGSFQKAKMGKGE